MGMPSRRGSLSQVSKAGFSLWTQKQIYMIRKHGRRATVGRHGLWEKASRHICEYVSLRFSHGRLVCLTNISSIFQGQFKFFLFKKLGLCVLFYVRVFCLHVYVDQVPIWYLQR